MLNLAVQYSDKAKEAGLTNVDAAAPIIGPREQETANELEGAFQAMEQSSSNMDQKFFSILNATASIGNILNIGANTFVGVLLSGLNTANNLANSIFGIISAFTGGGAGGILGLFGAQGGSFQGGQKIAGYASGVSGMVPQGFPNDSFPMMVQSGERVDITPTHKVGDNVKALSSIQKAIENLNQNMAANSGGSGDNSPIEIIMDGHVVSRINERNRNKLRNSGVNLEQI